MSSVTADADPNGPRVSPTPLIIGGRDVPGDGPLLTSRNPVDGAIVGSVGSASAEQVDRAVAEAAAAFRDPDWREATAPARADLLHRIATVIESEAEALAALQSAENGKALAECLVQAGKAASYFRYYAGLCETAEDALPPPRGPYLTATVHEPVGVVAAIVPWNSPLTMAAQKLAPALAAGNAVVLKAAETTSLVTLALGRACVDAGLPQGLVSVLAGGPETGTALVDHPGIDMISFTGGTSTGQHIARRAADRLLPLVLELGGKSPQIVFADADLEAAARGVAQGIFTGSGQSCVAGSRLFVESAVRAEFTDLLLAETRNMRVGPPSDPATVVGPLASFAHRDRVAGMVDAAVAEGARVLIGGQISDDPAFAQGAYYPPTILTDITNSATIARDEVFGPVLCLMPFHDVSDLVAQANDSDFGLAAGIWTGDVTRAWRVARALESGTVWINMYKELSIAAPFGGVKLSGLGREKGLEGMRAYQRPKSIYLAL